MAKRNNDEANANATSEKIDQSDASSSTETTSASQGTVSSFQNANVSTTTALAAMASIATNINTSSAAGAPLSSPVYTTELKSGKSALTTKRTTYSGMLVYDWIPSYGVVDNNLDPVNIANAECYSYVMGNITGRKPFESVDLSIYNMCLDSLYSLYCTAGRVLGLIGNYSVVNDYMPKALVEALGFDYDDWMINRPAVVSTLAEYGAALSAYPLPPYNETWRVHTDMNSAIYRDGGVNRAQMYAFRQTAFYSYEKVDVVQGLSLVKLPNNCKFSEWLDVFQRLFSAFQFSGDVQTIRTKCIQAWGMALSNQLPLFTMEYRTPIVKDDYMLISIMNADIVDVDLDSCRIYDAGNGSFRSYPRARLSDIDGSQIPAEGQVQPAEWLGSRFFCNRNVLNFVSDAPTGAEILAAMRFKVWIDESTFGPIDTSSSSFATAEGLVGYHFRLKHCGTEIITAAKVYSLSYDSRDFYDPFYLIAKDTASINIADIPKNKFYVHEPNGLVSYDVPSYLSLGANHFSVDGSGVIVKNVPVGGVIKAMRALEMLSRFDWHHGVSVGTDGGSVDLSTATFVVNAERYMPDMRDTQVITTIDDEYCRQFFSWYLKSVMFRKSPGT